MIGAQFCSQMPFLSPTSAKHIDWTSSFLHPSTRVPSKGTSLPSTAAHRHSVVSTPCNFNWWQIYFTDSSDAGDAGLAIWGDQSIALLNRSPKHPPGDRIFDRLRSNFRSPTNWCITTGNFVNVLTVAMPANWLAQWVNCNRQQRCTCTATLTKLCDFWLRYF